MAANERTPLTRPTDPPTYVEFAGLVRTRRTKLRQFQCCVCAFLLAIFIMALVVTVSYSINQMDPLVADSKNPEVVPDSPTLKSSWSPEMTDEAYPSSLTSDEWDEATRAGNEAIASREAADSLATPLPAPSPNSRHQFAVKTSLQAGKLALGGIGELAATRSVEAARAKFGAPSSVGSYFKHSWVPDGTCKEFTRMTCPPSKYRNFDGTCNHPRNLGAAMNPFHRKLPPAYADGVDAPRTGKYGKPLPSAREISLKVHPPSPSANPSFTVMLAVFGQFLDHDITATAISQGTNGSSLSCCPADTHRHPECFPVEVGPGDPVYDVAGRNCMEFIRSAPAPQCKIGPREQLNQVTAFIDASVIYGPNLAISRNLREGQGGLLRMFLTPDNRTLLPQSTDPNDGCNRDVESARGRYCFASGDGRSNENLHLTTMHLLWARQHNRIAASLAEMNPAWGDERIYQEARRIVGAQMQHIAYNEFVPIILGEKETDRRKLKPLASGHRPRDGSAEVNPSIANSFAAAAFRFAHTLLPGLMRVTNEQKSTSSYVELHRMLFNPYSLYSKGGMESSLKSATSNMIQKTTTHVTSQLTKHLFEDPLANKSIPCGLDLVSLNIQRGRDHGLPGYNAWRQYCGLGKVASFAELGDELDPVALNEISKVYDHVDDVDLYTGALAENDKADALIGPTFRCIIGDQFSRIQAGDRFWYEVPDEPQSFTEDQLKEIRRTSLAKLICDCSDGINEIQPEVMRSMGPGNPMTSCEDIAGPDLTAWKDSSTSPVLKATDMPETWLNFKTEINNTVQQIVGFFSKTVPAPGSPDWTTFKSWLNKSFTDVRNDVSAMHPKPVEPSATAIPLVQVEEKPGESVEAAGRINYVQFVMNRTLSIANEYSKTTATQPAIADDWINFKKDIKKSLNDALANATGSPTAEQREELKKFIDQEIGAIKAQIATVKAAKLYLSGEKSAEDAASTAEWTIFKNDLVKVVDDAVDRIKSNAPPPGDPAWATYGLDIKKQFASVKDHIPALPAPKLMAKDPTAAAYWDNFRNSLNKSIGNAVAGIDGNMPPPGDPAWAAFGSKIMNDFSGIKKKKLEKASEPEKPAVFDWTSFKTDLISSVADTVNEIKKNMPPPGSPAWAAFRGQIANGFAKIPSKPAASEQLSAVPTGTSDTDSFDWSTLKKDINKSVSEIIDKKKPAYLPAGATKWASLGAKFSKFNKTFGDIKNSVDSLRPKPEVSQLPVLTKDWIEFKKKINDSLAAAIESMNSGNPADSGWKTFGDSMKAEFAALKNEIANAKSGAPPRSIEGAPKLGSSSVRANEAQNWPEIPGDLASFQTRANETLARLKKSIVDLKIGATAPVVSAADWIAFKQEFKDVVVNFTKARNATEIEEWNILKDSVKKSFADLRDSIASLKNATVTLQKKFPDSDTKLMKGPKMEVAKDSAKNGKASNETIFDWEKLKTDINATIQNLLDDLGKIVPGKTPALTLRGSLIDAQSKFGNLKPPLTLTSRETLPDDWAVFVKGVNETLNGAMKRIDGLKPADKTDSAVLENYEKEANDFVEDAKRVVDKKRSELAAATSTASSLLTLRPDGFRFVTVTTLIPIFIAVF